MQITLTNLGAVTPDEAEETLQTVTDFLKGLNLEKLITLPEGTEMCMPGDNVDMKVELITPIAIEKGLRFAIREGGRTVGSGVVIDIEE